jgi:hypothetical protein
MCTNPGAKGTLSVLPEAVSGPTTPPKNCLAVPSEVTLTAAPCTDGQHKMSLFKLEATQGNE